MRIIENITEMQSWSEQSRLQGDRIVLVPTMGALHEAHLQLIREGRKRGDRLVFSIFVNPIQFSPNEDFTAYTRDLDGDLMLLEGEGVHVLFCPRTEAVYPSGFQTQVEVRELGRFLCGASRPGHFQGVATVVAKLFNMVRPQVAVFGLKDYQQYLIVRRLVEDLNFEIEIVGCPIVREADGLAMSSRNRYLNREEKKAALCLSRALRKAQDLVRQGTRDGEGILQEVRAEITREPLVHLEYLRLCDPKSLEDVETIEGEALLALAVQIGRARLIDNSLLGE